MDDIAERARAALAEHDWTAVSALLHPYVHWVTADGTVIRGRRTVMALVTAAAAVPAAQRVELRDGQVYRWWCKATPVERL